MIVPQGLSRLFLFILGCVFAWLSILSFREINDMTGYAVGFLAVMFLWSAIKGGEGPGS